MFCFVRILLLYLYKLKIMNKNYLLEILNDYIVEIRNNDYNNDELSLLIDDLINDLKYVDINLD